MIHIWRPLWERGWGLKQKWDVTGCKGVGVSKCFGGPIFISLLKKIRFTPWPETMLSQTLMRYCWQDFFLLNLTSDSETIFNDNTALFETKSKNRTRGQFECDVTYSFLFLLDFVHSHARCGCCFIFCLHFQPMQLKHVDCKMSAKKLFFFKKILIYLDILAHKRT